LHDHFYELSQYLPAVHVGYWAMDPTAEAVGGARAERLKRERQTGLSAFVRGLQDQLEN